MERPEQFSQLAYVTGQLIGLLSRNELKYYLENLGYSKEQREELIVKLKELARTFYV